MGGGEAIDAVDEPARGEDRRNRDRQDRIVAALGRGNRLGNLPEAGGEAREKGRAEGRLRETTVGAVENRPPQLFLSANDLLADGADGNTQLLGRRLQGTEPPHRLQRAKAVQMDEAEISHIVFLYPDHEVLD